MTAEKPKPCPFCGSDRVVMRGVTLAWVACASCSCMGPIKPTECAAIEIWNVPRRIPR